MAVVQTPVMHRGVIFFLAVFCWLLTGTASHALTRPPVAAPFISHEEQLKEESRWQDGPALTEGVAICYEMQSGLFVGNDPINYVDSDGMDRYRPDSYRNAPPSLPQTPAPGLDQSVIDAANNQFDGAFNFYRNGANALGYRHEFGPDEPWTRAIRQEYQSHFDLSRVDVRGKILDYCCKGKKDRILNEKKPASYSLNNLTPGENAEIFFGDMLRYTGISPKLQRTGSFNASYTINSIDCGTKCARVKFIANDAFRFGSMTRIPMTRIELGADNPFGSYRSSFNTVYLTWYWEETVCLRK